MDHCEQRNGSPASPPHSTFSIPNAQNATLQRNYNASYQPPASVTPSVRTTGLAGDLVPAAANWVRGWRLWTHTSRLGIAWMLTCEFTITGYIIARAIQDGMPTGEQWTTFAFLSVATVLYMSLTWPAETANRAARLNREHIDHTGVYTVAAAFVLPVSLMAVLVVAIRIARYTIASKPPVRVIFGTAAILASCLATQGIATATTLSATLVGARTALDSNDSTVRVLIAAGSVIGACIAYYGVQTLLVGTARGLGGTWSWRGTIGTTKENWEFIATIGLGILAAQNCTLATSTFLAGATAVAIVWTRSSQGEVDGHHDALTGLVNRGAFELATTKVLGDDLKADTTTAFVLFDIDFFKRINDGHGHAAGDAVLAAVARVLQEHSRSGLDIVGRWGGEEFAAVLPGSTRDDAVHVAERMRRAVAELAVPYLTTAGGKPKTISQITISAGIALSPTDGHSIDSLCGRADHALYQSKRGGRNRVTVAEPLGDIVSARSPQTIDGDSVSGEATMAIGA